MRRITAVLIFVFISLFIFGVYADESQMEITEAESNIRNSAAIDIDYTKGMVIDTDVTDFAVKTALDAKEQYNDQDVSKIKDLKTDVLLNLKGCSSELDVELSGDLSEYAELVDNIIINANDLYLFVKPSELSDELKSSSLELNINDTSKIIAKYNGTSEMRNIKAFLLCLFVFVAIYIFIFDFVAVKKIEMQNQSNKNVVYMVSAVIFAVCIVLGTITMLADWNALASSKQLTRKNGDLDYFKVTYAGSGESDRPGGIYMAVPLFDSNFNESTTAVFMKNDDGTSNDSIVGGKYITAMDLLQFPIRSSGDYYLKNNSVSFSDINKSDSGLDEAVSVLASRNIFSGKTDSLFAPDDNLTRADTAAMLCNILDIEPNTSSDVKYSDIDSGQWYYGYAVAAREKGIFNGYDDNSFRGANTITREEFATVLGQIMVNKLGYKLNSDVSSLNSYSDVGDIRQYAINYIALTESKDMKIWSGEFLPEQPVTRGEAAMLLYRMYCVVY